MSEEATTSEETPSVTFHIKSAGNAKYTVTVPLSTTTIDLKNKLSTAEYANVPATAQRLIYSGRVLKDEDTLAQYNVKEGNTMHLVKSAASNQRQNPANQTPTQEPTGAAPAQGAAGVPQNLAAGTGNNPLAGLTGARYAGHVQLPSASMFGADGGMGAPQGPEDMIQQLQDPHFAQMMNEALSNPQFIDMMIQSNPQLRAMGPGAREMIQSDHFRRMLTDPAALRQMFEFQRMMGVGPMGGAQETFAMPGETTTTDPANRGAGNTQGQPGSPPTQQANPFAALMGGTGGGSGAGANPFAAMLNPAFMGQATQRPQTNTTQTPSAPANPSDSTSQIQQPSQTQPAANPFAALFNPGMFGAPPQGGNADPNAAANPFANPMMQSMMQNPEMMRNVMQMMGGGGGAAAPGAAGAGASPLADPNALLNMMNMFGGAGGGGFGSPEPPDNRPPEERYATQLRQLNEMGMVDFDRNIQALRRSGGDVNGALEWLFSQPQ